MFAVLWAKEPVLIRPVKIISLYHDSYSYAYNFNRYKSEI